MISNFIERVTSVPTILPVTTVGSGAVVGVGVDRTGYLSAGVEYSAGICPSVPTGFTVALLVEHSADNSSWATFDTIATFGTAGGLSAASTVKYFDLNLRGAKKWIRITETLTFTGGTSPSQVGGVNFILGDKNAEPVGGTTVYGS